MGIDPVPETGVLFKKVQREATLATQVAEQLEDLILHDRLQQGEALPTERELAAQFGVSRTVVREALHKLVAKHLLEIQPGNRVVVSRPTAQFIGNSLKLMLSGEQWPLDLDKVMEVRRLLEIQIADLAAQRRNETDLTRMDEILSRFTIPGKELEWYAQADVDFHQALAVATQNPLFSVLLYSISDVMMHIRRTGIRLPNALERGYRYHQALYEAVKAGDAEGARQAMTAHLVEAEETQHRVLQEAS